MGVPIRWVVRVNVNHYIKFSCEDMKVSCLTLWDKVKTKTQQKQASLFPLNIYLLYWLKKLFFLLRESKSTKVEFWTNVCRTDTQNMVFFQMPTDAPARLDSLHLGCVRNVTRLLLASNNIINDYVVPPWDKGNTYITDFGMTGGLVSVWCLLKVGK